MVRGEELHYIILCSQLGKLGGAWYSHVHVQHWFFIEMYNVQCIAVLLVYLVVILVLTVFSSYLLLES